MSNSIFVPVQRVPLSLAELQQAMAQAFEEFGLARPNVQLHLPASPPGSLEDTIVTVQGAGPNDHCWISFNKYPSELTGVDATSLMGDVTTRGSWSFAAVAVLGLFDFGGSIAFNDSGELDGKSQYDAATLRKVIGDAIASGEQYLAQ